MDKLLAAVGLAESVTDATRKLKAGSVRIEGSVFKELVLAGAPPQFVIQVGKQWKQVTGVPASAN
jgi:hypothetical protein